ncbi:MAG: hypothetical protein Q7T44_13575 [Parvibaculum sp.]|nr:hypothetical protein [Parvibaculum sp.]
MKFIIHAAFAVALLGLAACADTPPPAPKGDIGFSGAPLRLDVATVAIDNQYVPSGQAPNIEQLHEVTPSTVAERWLQTRVVPVGTDGQALLTIYDARVVEVKLSTKGGLTGFFGDQVDTKIIGTLRAELTVMKQQSAGGTSVYKAGVTASSEQTLLQSATLNERDQAYFDLTKKLSAEFDRVLTAEVRRTMTPALRN